MFRTPKFSEQFQRSVWDLELRGFVLRCLHFGISGSVEFGVWGLVRFLVWIGEFGRSRSRVYEGLACSRSADVPLETLKN